MSRLADAEQAAADRTYVEPKVDKPLWTVVYDNDTGPMDEGFWQWWTVTDGNRYFRSESGREDAEWLCDLLNSRARPLMEQKP